MAGILDSVIKKYNYVIHDLADPRTADWWGVSNPLVVLSIVTSYLYFCTKLGPRLMKNRPPMKLKNVLFLYNLFQVFMSAYLVYEGGAYVLHKEYNLKCEPVDYSNNPRALKIAAGTWWYYFAKLTELIDTVLFVLRKKNNQVSFLHVYHHTLMSLVVWIGVKYFPGGHTIMMGFLNSIVHVIMYTYYLISGLGPEYQKYVWWKKHVTWIQLIQFCFIFGHNTSVFFYECSFPKTLNVICCINAIAFIYMFGKFYVNSYIKNKTGKSNLESKKLSQISSKINKFNDSTTVRRKIVEKSR